MAALRGNTEVVEYLIDECHADILKKDKSGQLPLDIAVKKRNIRTEWVLRRAMYRNNICGLVQSLGGWISVITQGK